jgi:hypothetical protein
MEMLILKTPVMGNLPDRLLPLIIMSTGLIAALLIIIAGGGIVGMIFPVGMALVPSVIMFIYIEHQRRTVFEKYNLDKMIFDNIHKRSYRVDHHKLLIHNDRYNISRIFSRPDGLLLMFDDRTDEVMFLLDNPDIEDKKGALEFYNG